MIVRLVADKVDFENERPETCLSPGSLRMRGVVQRETPGAF
jgi:hypothetical protein